ncbi:MAG: prepilin-type N-terminal cleavage/methylation domain-containing protein [Fibromonadales bacterium]|nr:prepilin-type N-terminal cleavage/methylation domain-containing protein [Fibromonadales bacterium]
MKRGFTLIELVVYMAILGFIIVVAGRVFGDSAIMRVRSQNMLKSAEVIGSVSKLLKEDISQMGVKAWGLSSASSLNVRDKVYWDANASDYSSYVLYKAPQSENFDSLVFKKAEFNEAGNFLGVRKVAYWVENSNLYRSCSTIDGNADSICPENGSQILIATNVRKFVLTPSRPGTLNSEDTLFAPFMFPNYCFAKRTSGTDVSENINVAGNGSTEIAVTGFSAQNNKNQKYFNQIYLVQDAVTAWENCIGMDFDKDDTYAVEFKMPPLTALDNDRDSASTQLLPGKDHIAVGIRNKSGNLPPGAPSDVLFYPPQSSDAAEVKRYAEFAISRDIKNACLAITFAFYSPKASRGKLRFKEFSVYRKADEAFHFPKNVADYGPKEKVKAFELAMEVEFNGEASSANSVITTPNNGIRAVASSQSQGGVQ